MKDKKEYFKEYYLKNKNKLKNKIKIWQLNNKDKVINYKKKNKSKKYDLLTEFVTNIKNNSKCKYCQETTPCCLDFHHVNPEKKSTNINRLIVNGVSIDRLKLEINKCIIICSNCHRKLHCLNTPTNRTLKFKFAYNYKQKSSCKFCFESYYACLDFHHVDPHNKLDTIGQMTKNKKYNVIDVKNEILKCIVVCSNCHRKIHNKLIIV